MSGGDHIRQYGDRSVGKQQHSGSGDNVAGDKRIHAPESPSAAMDNVLAAVHVLRGHLNEADRAAVDSAVRQLDPSGTAAALDGPLKRIAGIAALLGEVGVPVITAIKELLSFFSSS